MKYPLLEKLLGSVVLSDFARNELKDAQRALESEQVKNLGVHLMKWLMFPQAQERDHWRKEAEVALIGLFEDLVSSQKTRIKGGRRLVQHLWFGARDLQRALNGRTLSCHMAAIRLTPEDNPREDLDEDNMDTFLDFGFQVVETSFEGGVELAILFHGEPFISTQSRKH
jgi:hypothetical protein